VLSTAKTANELNVSAWIRLGRLVSYFTIESNLLVLAAAVSLVLAPGRDGRLWRVLRLDALLGVVIALALKALDGRLPAIRR
jgi:hypothetical protein